MKEIRDFTSEDFLEMALRCRHNSIVLKDASKLLFEKESTKRHGLFLYYTAAEEFQKGLFCMFTHRGIMRPEQMGTIFTKHETKILLFHMIFRNRKFYVKDGKFYYDDDLLKNLNLRDLANSAPDYVSEYYKKREDCLYVRPNSDGTTYDPSQAPIDIESEKERIHDELTYLNGIFEVVWINDFKGDLSDFDYYVLTPKDKPKIYNYNFSGSGELVKREKYKPDGFDERMGKLSD